MTGTMIGAIGGHIFRTHIGLVRHITGNSGEGEQEARKARHALSECFATFMLAPSSLVVFICPFPSGTVFAII